MNRLYRVLKFKISLLALLLLLVAVCYVLVGRIALALLPDYRPQLEHYLSQQLQRPVTIEDLHGTWVGFDPVFVVDGLVVNGADNLRVSRATIRVALLKSLLAQGPRLKLVTVNAAQVALQQEENGSWRLAGFALGAGSERALDPLPPSLIQLFDGANIALSDSAVVVADQKNRVRTWQLPLVSVGYRNDQVFASGQILELGGQQPLINFSLHGEGVRSLRQIQGMLYVEARSADLLDDVLKAYQWQQVSVQALDASARMWLAFDGLQVTNVQAHLQLRELNWQVKDQPLPPLVNVAAQVQWHNTEAGSELAMHWHGFDWHGQNCAPTAVRIGFYGPMTEFQIGALDVRCLSSLALALDLPDEPLRLRLEASEPQGMLENMLITLNHSTEQGAAFELATELDGLSVKAYHGTPALSGIDGYLSANPAGGSVIFNSERFELAFPDLFLAPWQTKQAEGAVSWNIKPDEVAVFSEGLRLRLPDESLVYGDFILRLNPSDREDYLSLALGMQDIPFQRVTHFVPYHAVGESLYHWLGKSLVAGKVSRGVYYGYGSTEQNHAAHSFTSSISLETEQGALLFADGWPRLTDLAAAVTLQNGALSVVAPEATIQQTRLSGVIAELPDKIGGVPGVLMVKTKLQAAPSDLQYWLTESPIASHTKSIAEQLKVDGLIDIGLDLEIPMVATQKVKYHVSSRFDGATIEHPGAALKFADVSGLLEVSSDKGVLASEVRTEVFGEAATLSIATYSGSDADASAASSSSAQEHSADRPAATVLSLNGRASVAALLKNYKMPPILGLSGALNYQARLSLPSSADTGTDYPELTLTSDLVGLARDWPAPFDKSAEQAERLDLNLLIKPNQMYLHLGLAAQDKPEVAAELLFVNHEFAFGEVLIGGASSSNNISRGLGVRAALPRLELTPWSEFVEQLTASTKALAEQRVLQQLDLSIDQLDAFGQHFRQVQAELSQDEQGWRVDLRGPDIAGRIALPTADQPLTIRLQQLSLRSAPEAVDESPQVVEPYDPRDIPVLSFATQQLSYNDQNFGAWSSTTEPSEQGVIFRDLEGTNGDTSLTGQLNWQYLQDQGQHNSILTLDAVGGDVDRFVQSMGWSSALTSQQFNAQVALVWADRPAAFDLAIVSGSIALAMQDGVLKTADEKTGALRVFGILNAETLRRRLTLDFSDLYQSGVSYDQLSVKAKIDQGQLTLFEPLSIEGPSSKYVVNGMADLTKQTLDMDMLVELPFSQNVPLAGLLLGAPQVGGAVWVIDKLLGEPLSAITTARYDITGSWDEPTMTIQQVINASKKKRSRNGEQQNGEQQ